MMVLVVNFFDCFCFVVALFDLVYDAEAIFYLAKVLKPSGNLF